jgi:hypothetical protein
MPWGSFPEWLHCQRGCFKPVCTNSECHSKCYRMQNWAGSYLPNCWLSYDESSQTHRFGSWVIYTECRTLEDIWLHYLRKRWHYGHSLQLGKEGHSHLFSVWIGCSFWCHLLGGPEIAGEGARQGVRNTVLSCLVPVRSDFILAHSSLWNDPHSNLILLICVVMQGSHWIS